MGELTFSVSQACTSTFIWTQSMCIWWSAHGLLRHLSQVQILKRCTEYPEKFETTSSDQLMSKCSLILQIQDENGDGICRLHVVHAASNVKVQRSHRKNSPLIRIDGDAVQLQRTEYGRCQTDVELHGVRLAVR